MFEVVSLLLSCSIQNCLFQFYNTGLSCAAQQKNFGHDVGRKRVWLSGKRREAEARTFMYLTCMKSLSE